MTLNKKRVLSFILSAVMLLTMIPVGVSGADIVNSGTRGVTWTLDGEGTLTISGTGAMPDYNSSGPYPPWGYRNPNIYNVVIEDGVTSIGNYAFRECKGITSVTIPGSVKKIGDSAFFLCTGLISVTIPDGVTSIGIFAFSGCWGLGSVTIPGSVTSIGKYAFYLCRGLTSVTIPDGVTSIGEYAFSGCSGLKSVTIPGRVTSIENYTFSECTGLMSVTIGGSVTTIGKYAFANCSGLKSVMIPDSVTVIGDYAFAGCASLADVYYSALRRNWTWIYICSNNEPLLNAVIHFGCGMNLTWRLDIGGTLTISGTGAMTDYGVGKAPWYSARADIHNVVISNGVTSIGNHAFYECTGLTSVTIPGGVTTIGKSAFEYCTELASVSIPGSVKSIGNYAFRECKGITSVSIPGSVTSIGDSAFFGCTDIESITVAAGNTVYRSVGNCLIETETKKLILGCKNSVIPNDGSVTTIGKNAFYYCRGLESVTIPESVTSIGYNAFSGCTGLTEITIPDSVTSIGSYAFSGCSGLERITVAEGNTVYRSAGNCLIETETKKLILGCQNSVIPNDGSVTSIGDYAFYCCTGPASVTIPNSVTSIGESAFDNCSGLTSVTIPDSVTTIGDAAFAECPNLTSVTIPNSVTSIGESTFDNCSGLTSVTIPDSVTTIGTFAFRGCSSLTSVTIPESVTSIDYGAFVVCSGLTDVTIPDGVTSIGDVAFAFCTGLTSVTIPDGVTSIGYGTFGACSGLTSFTIPNSVTRIGADAFNACSGLEDVTIPGSVKSIGKDAFKDDTSLKYIFYGGSKTEWENALDPSNDLPSVVVHFNSTGDHNWNDGTVTTPATCVAGGEMTYKCTVDGCDAEKTVAVPPDGNAHTWNDGVVTTPATCATEGVKTYTCTGCNDTKTEPVAKNPANHAGGTEIRNVKAATCGDDGYTGDTYCKGCGTKLSSGVVIPATGNHTWNDGEITIPASCAAEGVKTYTCSVCKQTKTETVAKNPANHAGGTELRNVKAATYTEDGYTGDTYCKGCGAKLSSGITIPAIKAPTVSAVSDKTEVAVGDEVTVTVKVDNAAGLEEGSAWLSFDTSLFELLRTGNGDISASNVFSHADDEIAQANTEGMIHNLFMYYSGSETKNTVTIYTATFKAKRAGTAAFGFVADEMMNLTVAGVATVTVSASQENVATVSAVSDKTEVTVGDEITVTVRVDNAVGLEYGTAWLTFDNSLLKLQSTGKGDTMARVSTSETPDEIAQANSEGMIHNSFAYTRSETNGTVTIYTATFKAISSGTATFGFAADELMNLTVGSVATVTVNASPANHSWDAGKVTTAATCSAEGVKTYTCTVCSETKTEPIAKDPANHAGGTELRNVKAATCGTDGYTGDTYCKGCGAKLGSGTVVNKTGHHSWNDGKVTTPATTASGGKITYTCTVCGQTKTEDTPKLPSTEPTTVLPPVTEPTDVPSTDPQKPTVPDKIFNYDGDDITCNEESETIKYASKAALKKSELVGAIEAFDGATVVIRDKGGVELSDDTPLGTGVTVSIVAPNGEVIAVKTIIFIGDVDGDATVNANDARLALRAAAKLDTLEGIFAAAADVNGDNGINAIDARGILRAAAKLDVLSLA